MGNFTYCINNLQFVLQEDVICTVLFADVKVYVSQYLYGDDADGNRGVYVTDRESQIEEVRDIDGNYITITDEMEAEVQRIVSERGDDLQ